MHSKFITIIKYSNTLSFKMLSLFWAIIFIYSILIAGHCLFGIIGLIFISILAFIINISKYYSDYIFLVKSNKKSSAKQNENKIFKPLIFGIISSHYIYSIITISAFFLLALGIFLYFKCGKGIVNITIAGTILSSLIIFRQKIKYSELLPSLFYVPLLFYTTYFVMTKTLTFDVILLSIPYVFLSTSILYVKSINDYNIDSIDKRQTIANSFNSQLDSLIVFKWILILAYITPLFLCAFDILDWQILLIYCTIPTSINIYNTMQKVASEKHSDYKPIIQKTQKLIIIYVIISIIAIFLSTN